jgi:hypothetical protein
LGLESKTNGSFRHEFWMGIINALPLSAVQSILYKVGKKVFELRKNEVQQRTKDD